MELASKEHLCLFSPYLLAVLVIFSEYLKGHRKHILGCIEVIWEKGKVDDINFPQTDGFHSKLFKNAYCQYKPKVVMPQGYYKRPHPQRKDQVKDGQFGSPIAWLTIFVMPLKGLRFVLILFYESILLTLLRELRIIY